MAEAKSWAHHLVQRDDWLVIDVETTGLDGNAEIVEAAVVGPRGDTCSTPSYARARRPSQAHCARTVCPPKLSIALTRTSRSTES